VTIASFDGSSDDLLTAGLGKSGLASKDAPGYANASAPTPAELRKNAIWANYRALVDMTAGGGYGTLYGPNVGVGTEPRRRTKERSPAKSTSRSSTTAAARRT
jgi:hydroxybutyrate-dimer hydrolase